MEGSRKNWLSFLGAVGVLSVKNSALDKGKQLPQTAQNYTEEARSRDEATRFANRSTAVPCRA